MWNDFLRRSLRLNDGTTIQTHKWVEYLVRDGILPLLKQMGYDLLCQPPDLANCILNHLIRHEAGYHKCKFTTYQCKHREEVMVCEMEFFEERIPEMEWNRLRKQFAVEWFADNEPFADRVWLNLPFIILSHLKMNSPANQILYEKMRIIEEGDESSDEELCGPGIRAEWE
jgi:hypothetical protein